MTKRATRRPEGLLNRKPDHWTNAPAPSPRAPEDNGEELSPTRYGDWEKNGIAIDF